MQAGACTVNLTQYFAVYLFFEHLFLMQCAPFCTLFYCVEHYPYEMCPFNCDLILFLANQNAVAAFALVNNFCFAVDAEINKECVTEHFHLNDCLVIGHNMW